MLDRDLDEAEEQYSMALRAHLKEHDFLLEIQRSQAKATVRCVKIDHPAPAGESRGQGQGAGA